MKKDFDAALSVMMLRTGAFSDLRTTWKGIGRRQFEAFQAALDSGYYDTPKRTNIKELATRLGRSPSTVAEHLRKAEAKLLPIFWKVFKKMQSF